MAVNAAIHHKRGSATMASNLPAGPASSPAAASRTRRARQQAVISASGPISAMSLPETDKRLIDDIGVPASLDEGDLGFFSHVEPPVSRTVPRR
jgi:hypothetical protein